MKIKGAGVDKINRMGQGDQNGHTRLLDDIDRYLFRSME